MKDLSIIIVNYNAGELLQQCLDRVFRFTEGLDFEVIVVDNASTDGNAAWLGREYPQVKLLRNESNAGFSKANNQGLAVSEGRTVLFLNPDTELRENAIAKLHAFLIADERMGACGCTLVYPGGAPQWSYGFYPSLPRMLWITVSGLLGIRKGRKPHAAIPEGVTAPMQVEYICGADLMVRRSVLDQVGGFDEYFFAYCEETDLCCRIRRAGYEIWLSPETRIVHHIGETFAPGKAEIYYTSLFRYFKKHYGWYLPARWYLLAKFGAHVLFGCGDEKQRRDIRLRFDAIKGSGLTYPFPVPASADGGASGGPAT
ncbi:MAG: glycosyltransferase family 2 protein [Kiritimatiellae bacterium]|nr:glycosyltransferase family 2 protein [Kiritimatiellia bacterium]